MKYKLITIIAIIIFSILLWVFVSFSNAYSTTVRVPVVVQNIPKGYAIKNLSTSEISLTVKGEGWELAQLTFGAENNLMLNAVQDEIYKTISVRNVIEQNSWVSSKLQVTLVEPEQIAYELEEVNYKDVNVNSKIRSNFKVGYGLVSELKIEPETVRISGAKSIIKQLDFISTDSTFFEDLDKVFSLEVPLDIPVGVNCNTKDVTITMDIQKIVDKTFENIVVLRKGVPPSRELSLFPERVNVVLRGGIKLLGKLNSDDIEIHVNFRQALQDSLGSIEPQINIPNFTTLVDVRPSRLDYIIKQF